MGTELKVMIINLLLTVVLLDISYGQSVCDSGPCQNGGTCNDLTTSYTCSCIAGFTGINCETNIDDCSKKPCVYGTCIDGINQYTCICKSGFTGVNCTLDIDECATIAPCQNGGTCTNRFGWYLCTCPAGDYYGNNCEIVSPPPAECSAASRPRVLTDGSGTISSPFYDGTTRYPKNFTCQWIITSGIPNGLISLQFTKTSGCTGDIISLYDGVDITARRIVSTALPSTIAPYTSIAGSSLFITFVSTGTVISSTCTGFIASYTSLPPLPSGCISFYYTTIPKPPMLLTAAAGTLTSTYYPNNYTNWLQCDWLITSVWPTGIVRLDFSDFILGLSTDMVYLYDGNSSYPASMPPLITSLNRTSNPLTTPFSSSQRSMIVRMFADISNNHRGFSATYTSIPPECVAATRPLTASASSSGVISSPNYPNNYFTTGDCQWLITADSNMKVVLQITAFSTDVNDVLYVYDGNSNTATQLSALSGISQTTPITITTTQNYMFIRFTSDASVVSSGFQATYTQVY